VANFRINDYSFIHSRQGGVDCIVVQAYLT
jgi:hypothetical protein